MPSITVRPSRSADLHASIVEAVTEAVERLMEGGESFTALGVQRIADEAGIARSTFYRYFPDKSTLLIEIAGPATAEQFSVPAAWMASAAASREGLEQVMATIIARHREHRHLVAALEEVAGYDQAVAAFWRGRVEENSVRLRDFIAAAQREGRADPDLDPLTSARLLSWGVERLAAQHVAARPASEDAALARGLCASTWAMLGLGREHTG